MAAPSHWLDRYGNNFHAWNETVAQDGQKSYVRPMGLIERGFDIDGTFFEGRADISGLLEVDFNGKITQEQLRNRILLAWTALRLSHTMIMAKATDAASGGRDLVIDQPEDTEKAIKDASDHITFVQDFYPHLDTADFYLHASNVARVVDPDKALVRLFVLPITKPTTDSLSRIGFLTIMGHVVSDGLTAVTWLNHFLQLLNQPVQVLRDTIAAASSPESMKKKLLPPQEDLYPPISGNLARQRWYWAISRILRHVHKPQPPNFPNPTYRHEILSKSVQYKPTYSALLDYSKVPPLNSASIQAKLSLKGSQKLVQMCKKAGASVGAGCFVLIAIVMMELHEQRNKNNPEALKLPYANGFPLNPRPFFGHHEAPDSMMLAFCDEFILPFLPSSIPFAKRFNFYIKKAQRQLEVYQKRVPSPRNSDRAAEIQFMSVGGAGRLLGVNYLGSIDRLYKRLTLLGRTTSDVPHPQAAYAMQPHPTLATCGISSLGRSTWNRHTFNVEEGPKIPKGEDSFVADFRNYQQNVRARDGEFLVGIGSDTDGYLVANASYDANAVDAKLAEAWKIKIESILDIHEHI